MPCFVTVLSPPARKPLTATLTPKHRPKLRKSKRRELSKPARDKGILETGGSDYHAEGKGSVRLALVRVPGETVAQIHRGRQAAAEST